MKNKTFLNRFKLFGINNLMLESNFRNIEKDGMKLEKGEIREVNLGKHSKLRKSPVDKSFFEEDIRNKAKKMSEFYELYYSIENTIRRLISEKLDKLDSNWWKSEYVPQGIIDEVEKRVEDEKSESMEVRSEDLLTYTNFGELIKIIEKNWQEFSDTLRSRDSMKKVLGQLNKIRNVIAHSCELNEDDITRFELAIRDWFLRVQT
ncbi:MAG: hypothetical protein KC516_00930 [Nanoarchaeota archaeon]|nr:hypothetical protein [Nanoarchaeota archaeon]